jgi:ligand-binding sensor domain-containing protein
MRTPILGGILFAASTMGPSSIAHADWFYLEGSGGLGITWASTIGPDGSIWFGADTGVASYDGLTLRRHPVANYPDPFYDARALVFDRQGRLWCGTQGGVARLDSSSSASWVRFPGGTGIPNGIVHAMAMDSTGTIWAGTELGLARFDGTAWSPEIGSLGASQVNSILCDRGGMLWVATTSGLHRRSGKTWLPVIRQGSSLPSDNVKALFQDSRERIWVGTASAASVFEPGGAARIVVPPSGDTDFLSLGEDARGALWIGTGSMLHRFDGTTWSKKTVADGLPDPTVSSIVRDPEGAMWFGTNYGSVARYDGTSWTVHRPEVGGLPNRFARRLSQDRAGRIWAATFGGAARWDGAQWTPFTVGSTAGGLDSDNIWKVLEDSFGDTWFVTEGARVARLRGNGSWTSYRDSAQIFSSLTVTNVSEAADSTLWFSTDDGVISFRRNPERWQRVVPDGVSGPLVVHDVLRSASGDVWFATDDGAFRLSQGAWSHPGPVYRITCLLEDHTGRIWLGASGGVFTFDGTSLVQRPYRDLRDAELVDGIQEDALGNIWIATAGGAHRLGVDADGSYSTSDGLGDDRATDVLVDRDGTIWFTNTAGVIHHEPDYVAPRPFFSPRPPSAHGSRSLIVSYTSGYLETGQSFSFSLNGAAWTPWSAETQSFLTGLSEGANEIRVRSRDRIGNVSTLDARADVEVDSDAPLPLITYPALRQAVRGEVPVRGDARDDRFLEYTVELKPLDDSGQTWTRVWTSPLSARDTLLARFDSRSWMDGEYELRVTVSDTLGLKGSASTRVIIDNVFPDAAQTAPQLLNGARGGSVYSTSGEIRLDFAPGFADTVVAVDITVGGPALPLPPSGARSSPFMVNWLPPSLRRQPALHAQCTPAAGPDSGVTVYRWTGATQPIGGTFDHATRSVETRLEFPGIYVVGNQSTGVPHATELGELSMSPRVLNLGAGGSTSELTIAFELGTPTEPDIRIYNRAGRLVRALRPAVTFTPGMNVVRWDGRGEDSRIVEDGLYLVTVRAFGTTRTQAISVVR